MLTGFRIVVFVIVSLYCLFSLGTFIRCGVIRSPVYMAPEVLCCVPKVLHDGTAVNSAMRSLGPTCDTWSLGIILIQLVMVSVRYFVHF